MNMLTYPFSLEPKTGIFNSIHEAEVGVEDNILARHAIRKA
jgi:hypothetical protein